MPDPERQVFERPRPSWMVSLHGGHSGDFCGHAEGTLRELLEAAIEAGYHTFGVSEHVPRTEERFLYPEERLLGMDLARIRNDFARYTDAIQECAREFDGRLTVLRGFEAEVVPQSGYGECMKRYRATTLPDGTPAFDYFVGSVHYVEEVQIDGDPALYRDAAAACGGPEALAIRYYETVAEMTAALRPDVIGHLDLIKKNCRPAGFSDFLPETPRIRAAAEKALESARAAGSILDLNTAGWRKGLGEPYPAPWLVHRAREIGIPFCFGDDSHRRTEVGAHLAAGRDYLLACRVNAITLLTRAGARIGAPLTRKTISLEY